MEMTWKEAYDNNVKEFFPMKNKKAGFVNVDVLTTMAAWEYFKNGRDKDAISAFLNKEIYNNRMPLTKELKAYITDKVISGDENIKDLKSIDYKNTFLETYTGQELPPESDAKKNLLFSYGDFMSRIGSPRTTDSSWYITEYLTGIGNPVYDSVAGGTHSGGAAGQTPFRIGQKYPMKNWTLAIDYKVQTLIKYKFIRDYEAKLFEMHEKQRQTQMNKAFLVGELDGSYAVGDPATGIMDGFEVLLEEATGSYTDPEGNTNSGFFFKSQLKPAFFSTNQYLTNTDTKFDDLSGADMYAALEEAVEHFDLDEQWASDPEVNSETMDINVSARAYSKLRRYWEDQVFTNQYSTAGKTGNLEIVISGHKVVKLLQMSGVYAIIGNLKNAYPVVSTEPEASKTYREFVARLSGGGSGFEYTDYLTAGLGIDNLQNFYLVGAKLKDASTEIVAATPELWTTRDYKTAVAPTAGTDAITTFYASCASKLTTMYYTAGATPADPTNASTVLAPDTLITLPADEAIKVIAYSNVGGSTGTLVKSAIKSFTNIS